MFDNIKKKHQGTYQLIKYILVSGIATLVDFAVFNLLNLWLLVPLKSIDFSWWILDYNSSSAGGLAAFISTVSAYFFAQAANFIIQRKATFHADNNAAASGVMYFIMIIAIWILQIVLGGIFLNLFNPLVGEFWGGNFSRAACNFIALLIQFPLNKYVIMKSNRKE